MRRVTAPLALAEAGGVPNSVGGCMAGGITGARSESARVGRATGKSEERAAQDEGARGEMATAANVKWGELTAARRCEACNRRASRKIFF